jgi:predicted dehydrogenase
VALEDAEVVVVVDKKQERLEHIQSLYPKIQVSDDHYDLFNLDLDAAVIATPPPSHYEIANDCLNNGLHTFVEKPITLNSIDCRKLVDIANQKKLTLMVGHTFEYNPAVRKVKEIIQSGELGKIYYIDAVRVNLGLFQSDLDVIWDLAPHDISILHFLLGTIPTSVQAIGEDCIFSKKNDLAYMHIQFPDNISAHLRVSWLDPQKVRQITVVGSQKMLVYNDIENIEKIKIYDKGVEKPPYTDSFAEFQCSYRYGDVVIPNIQFTEPLRVESQHFIDCIRDESMQPISSGEQGLLVVQTLEAAERSMERDGKREKISVEEMPMEIST